MVTQNFGSELREITESIDRAAATTLKKIGFSVASQLQHFREAKGLSQSDLAKLLGTGQSRISQMEDPKYGKLSLSSLAKAAVCLDCELVIEFRSGSSRTLEASEAIQLARLAGETLKQSPAQFASAIETKPQIKAVDAAEFSDPPVPSKNIALPPAGNARNQKWVI